MLRQRMTAQSLCLSFSLTSSADELRFLASDDANALYYLLLTPPPKKSNKSSMIDQKTHSPEQLLALLEAAIRDAPAFIYGEPLTEKDIRWLGRADALLEASGAMPAVISFRVARQNLGTYSHDRNNLLIPLYDALSRVELQAPSSLQGAFIPSGDTWNGYAALVRIVQKASDDIMIVDPYLNSDIYIHFAPHTAARNGIRLLTTKRPENHSGLLASAQKWEADEISKTKSVEVRYAPAGALHDRLIIIDSRESWLVSQSIKDIAKRSPASVTRAEAELGQMKAKHYEALWNQSTPLA